MVNKTAAKQDLLFSYILELFSVTEKQRPITPVVTPNLGFQYEINHPKSSSSSFSDNADNKNVEISTIAANNYNNNDGNVQTFINTDTYQQFPTTSAK